ncbi:unnamed protein product [Pleuronectes platessa]|uniref:Uncharacterized protein n=1 Tax=Pleuronectes platessa TaxID=8262 RepID=A0A9N7U2I8_PLEPL|nr:unnamed protein product [Pleuronectes platessa]
MKSKYRTLEKFAHEKQLPLFSLYQHNSVVSWRLKAPCSGKAAANKHRRARRFPPCPAPDSVRRFPLQTHSPTVRLSLCNSNYDVISPSEFSLVVLIKRAKMAPLAFLPLTAVLLKSAGCLQSKMAEEESADRQPAVRARHR